jgi:osmoprotectant transport system ATP-binding protein
VIVLENVKKSYDSGRSWAVAGVSFQVPSGKLLALVGLSGCGKTTTMKMINRLTEPTEGRILVAGRDVQKIDPVSLRRTIGYVFQGIGLFPHMSVAENIAVVPRLLGPGLGWDRARIARRVHELLDLVGLPRDFASRRPGQLSGGQQQRIGFARALAAEPKVMLLDEPFGALDPVRRDLVRQDFRKIRGELRLTAVLVTHDMAEALLSADLIAVMRNGRVLKMGSPREMLRFAADRQPPATGPDEDAELTDEQFVARLMNTPRNQADELEALAAGPSPEESRRG